MTYHIDKTITLTYAKTGEIIPGHLIAKDTDDHKCFVAITYNAKELRAIEYSFWFAFNNIREILEKDGLIPRLAGACINLGMSGMANDMGRGIRGYILEEGVFPNNGEMIEIFSDNLIGDLTTREMQKSFYKSWLENSLAASPRIQPNAKEQWFTRLMRLIKRR